MKKLNIDSRELRIFTSSLPRVQLKKNLGAFLDKFCCLASENLKENDILWYSKFQDIWEYWLSVTSAKDFHNTRDACFYVLSKPQHFCSFEVQVTFLATESINGISPSWPIFISVVKRLWINNFRLLSPLNCSWICITYIVLLTHTHTGVECVKQTYSITLCHPRKMLFKDLLEPDL